MTGLKFIAEAKRSICLPWRGRCWAGYREPAQLGGVPRTGARVFDIQINSHWKSIRATAGLDGVRLHDLRHTYASHALAQGEHILTIGKLLGHRDPETTFKYAHLADAHIQQTARSVSAAIAKGM